MNKALKGLLRAGLVFLEETNYMGSDLRNRARDMGSDLRDRARDQMDDLTSRGRKIMRQNDGSTLREIISFAAGVGIGAGIALLFAPASGEQTRGAIAESFQEMGGKVRERFTPEAERYAG